MFYSKINCIPEGRKILQFISIICIKIWLAPQLQTIIFEYEALRLKVDIDNLAISSKYLNTNPMSFEILSTKLRNVFNQLWNFLETLINELKILWLCCLGISISKWSIKPYCDFYYHSKRSYEIYLFIKVRLFRSRQGSNLRGKIPLDFKSNA